LPDSLAPWVDDIGNRLQCPLDYLGTTALTALGTVIGRRIGIKPQVKTDWIEIPNLWGMFIGRPGMLKSPAMEAALSPLKRLAAQAAESHNAEMEEYQGAARLTKLRAEASEKAARAKLAKNPAADVSGDLVDDEREAPTLRRYIANDTTAAALGELLRFNSTLPAGPITLDNTIIDNTGPQAVASRFADIRLGPGNVNFDTSLVKDTRIKERLRLRFQFDAFNLFNTPSFGFPNANIGSATAGKITSTLGDNRDLQFALKFEF
jgi:hypothetical protein